jgi:protein-disulfide isomerase
MTVRVSRRRGARGRSSIRPIARGAIVIGTALAATPAVAVSQEASVIPSDASTLISRADRGRILGSDDAPIRIVEISDFQCPFCARFNRETFAGLDSLYIQTEKVQWVWIGFPSPNHPRAFPAIEAGFCAASVGKFWPMHDLLFVNQPAWTAAADASQLFVSYAVSLGIDGESFAACIADDRMAPLIVRDYESVVRAGISQTPFFIVADSVPVVGAAPLEQFVETIDDVLEAKGGD